MRRVERLQGESAWTLHAQGLEAHGMAQHSSSQRLIEGLYLDGGILPKKPAVVDVNDFSGRERELENVAVALVDDRPRSRESVEPKSDHSSDPTGAWNVRRIVAHAVRREQEGVFRDIDDLAGVKIQSTKFAGPESTECGIARPPVNVLVKRHTADQTPTYHSANPSLRHPPNLELDRRVTEHEESTFAVDLLPRVELSETHRDEFALEVELHIDPYVPL